MREIKFRIWAKDRGCFITIDTQSNDGHGLTLDGKFSFCGQGYFGFNPTPEDFIVQQFTGLYDKNKKEIYEGDILKGFHWDSPENIVSGEVVYLCGQWYLYDHAFYLGECLTNNKDPDTLYDFEVIGNIFENA